MDTTQKPGSNRRNLLRLTVKFTYKKKLNSRDLVEFKFYFFQHTCTYQIARKKDWVYSLHNCCYIRIT